MSTLTIVPRELSGFDLGPVLDWLEANRDTVKTRLSWLNTPNSPFHVNAEGIEYLQLTAMEIGNVVHRFPEAARKRSALRQIKGMPTTWFRNDSTVNNPKITENPSEALGPRTLVPGHNNPIVWDREHKTQEIQLYHLGSTSPDIAKYMAAHAFIHEYTHTLLNPLWYSMGESYVIRLPDGEEVDGSTFMIKFAVEANMHPGISHYAATYRPFPSSSKDEKFKVRVGEEFCESVAAYMLGYIYCEDPDRCFDPFKDRPEVKKIVEDFLNTHHVFNI
jgi:hypothetical protein